MSTTSKPKPRKMLPPVYWLFCIVVMFILDGLLPFGFRSGPITWGFGLCFISTGCLLGIYSAALFKQQGTPVTPFHRSKTLVVTGPFKLTRNPMYLGMCIALFGVAITLGNPLLFVMIPLFILVIQKRFIEPEELFLEALFSEEYLQYKRRVRRWL